MPPSKTQRPSSPPGPGAGKSTVSAAQRENLLIGDPTVGILGDAVSDGRRRRLAPARTLLADTPIIGGPRP